MMIRCDKHGNQPCVQMSSDLMRAMLRTEQLLPFVTIMFHCAGDRWLCYLSPQFANEHGIDASGEPIELEDQPWLAGLGGFCRECFEARLNRVQETPNSVELS
jgi:hypothetical protein